jgi:hypothetical protein
VLKRRAARVEGRTRGRQYTVPTSKGWLAKILSPTRYGRVTAKRGDRGRPGALTLPQAASGTCDRYRGFCLPPLFLAAPSTRPLSLSHYCQHDVTLLQYPCAMFPYLCLLRPSSYHPANKTRSHALHDMQFITTSSCTFIPKPNRSSLHQTCRTKHLGQQLRVPNATPLTAP